MLLLLLYKTYSVVNLSRILIQMRPRTTITTMITMQMKAQMRAMTIIVDSVREHAVGYLNSKKSVAIMHHLSRCIIN